MTNLEKIENWVASREDIIEYFDAFHIEGNLYLITLIFVEGSEYRSGGYDLTINDDDTITFLDHLR
jgi:hypothetical protein